MDTRARQLSPGSSLTRMKGSQNEIRPKRRQRTRTKRTTINQLIQPTLRVIILRRKPRLHQRRTVIALDEMVLEPR